MAGPTTEVLNDDLKALREDFHRFSIEVREDNHRSHLKAAEDVHKLGLEVRVLATKVNAIVGVAALVLIAIGSGIVSGIWWAATLSGDVKHLAGEVAAARTGRETSIKAPEPARPSVLDPGPISIPAPNP